MFVIACILATLAININFSASRSCESFQDVLMLLHDEDGCIFNKTVNGCIERIGFEGVTITKAYVREQKILKLGRDSIRNMKYLTTVRFSHCGLENGITPTAFRNVPSLRNMEIADSKLQKIPKGVFNFELTPKLEQLKIGRNKVSMIEDQAFDNLINLKRIYLCDNELEYWRSEWFINATSLELLECKNNKIKSIPKRAFADLGRLRQIVFDNNEITEIQRDAFKEIRSLEYLGLSRNKLTVLEEHSFPNTVRILTFAIGANYLNYLSNEVLKKLTAVELLMDYNPWKCPCLERINYWLYIKNGKIKSLDICTGLNIPICATPSSSPEICSDSVDSELTRRYISTVKNISSTLDPKCARLD